MKQYYVYILASRKHGTTYIGVTNDLVRRVYQHKSGDAESFTKKHNIKRLVYFEITENIESAIVREKQMKKWNRAWKVQLIENINPEWDDLYETII